MIVVSDTTAITTLLKSGDEELLAKLFGTVIVPIAVWDELRAFHIALAGFIEVRPLLRSIELAGAERLGRGEVKRCNWLYKSRLTGCCWMIGKPASLLRNSVFVAWRSPACS